MVYWVGKSVISVDRTLLNNRLMYINIFARDLLIHTY